MRRSQIVTILAAGLLLTACGGAAAPSSAAPSSVAASKPASTAASISAPTSASPASSAAAKPAGSAAGGATIKIGLLEPLTGPDSVNGKDNQDGFNLYLDSVNGTMAGRKVQAIVADTQAKSDVGLTKAKELVESDKVQLLMGISQTPVCYAVAGYVKAAQVPLIVSTNCGASNLTIDPKFASPYLVRLTQVGQEVIPPGADWAYSQGYHKVDLITSDYGGGLETADIFAAAFIKRGGSIIQELHPPLGTADYGPHLAQLNQQADLIVDFGPGAESLHFMDQYSNYAGTKKLPVLDLYGQITNGTNVAQLKDKAVGVVSDYVYSEGLDTPENKAFLDAFHKKYPGRLVSPIAAQGYSAAQFLEAALKSVNGNIEDKQAFLNALYKTKAQTAKGPLSLDQYHDVVQNIYIYQEGKQGDTFNQKVLKTYSDQSQLSEWTPEELKRLNVGQMKGKWVGMTKEQLAKIVSG